MQYRHSVAESASEIVSELIEDVSAGADKKRIDEESGSVRGRVVLQFHRPGRVFRGGPGRIIHFLQPIYESERLVIPISKSTRNPASGGRGQLSGLFR